MANRALGSFPTVNIASWLNAGGPMQIPSGNRTVVTATTLPADRRGTHHSAARLTTIAGHIANSGSKFRTAGDYQSGSPAMLQLVQQRLTTFMNRPVVVPNLAATASDTFVSYTDAFLLFTASWAYRVGLDTSSTLDTRVQEWFGALATQTPTWDLLSRGTAGDYMFSAHKANSQLAAAYGFARYRITNASYRQQLEQQFLRNAWHAVGSWSYKKMGDWFPNRLNDDYSNPNAGWFDYSYGAGNPYQYIHLGVKSDGSTKFWQIPSTAASFGNQWGQCLASAALGAVLVPDRTELLNHVKRAFMEQIAFGCFPIAFGAGCVPSEVGIRADDRGNHDQGIIYSGMLVNGAGLAAAAAKVSLSDTDMFDYVTSAGARGSAGGAKSFAKMVQSMLDLRSGVIPMASVDRGPQLGLPSTPLTVASNRLFTNFQTYPGKPSVDRAHETNYLFWREFDPSIKAHDYYKRTGDFAGKPLLGTSGFSIDIGNTYGNEYGTDIPLDPALLFSFQDLLGNSTTPAPPPPTTTPTVATIYPPSVIAGAVDLSVRVYSLAGATVVLENANPKVTIADYPLATVPVGETTISRTGANQVPTGIYRVKMTEAGSSTPVYSATFTLSEPFLSSGSLDFNQNGAVMTWTSFAHARLEAYLDEVIDESGVPVGSEGIPAGTVSIAGVSTNVQTASTLIPAGLLTPDRWYRGRVRDPDINGNWSPTTTKRYQVVAAPPPAVVEPTYSVTPLSISTTVGGASVPLVVNASGPLPVQRTVTITSSNPGILNPAAGSLIFAQGATAINTLFTPLSGGACTITIQVANQTFSIPANIDVPVLAPTISTTALPGGTESTFYYQVLQAASSEPVQWGASGLPQGLSLSVNNGVWFISGIPLLAGQHTITITASNSGGSVSRMIPLTITSVSSPDPEASSGDIAAYTRTPDPKRSDDRLRYAVDFRPLLGPGEQLVAPVLSVDVRPYGAPATDPSSVAMLSGDPQTLSNGVLQFIEGGIKGMAYVLSARARTTSGVIVTGQTKFRVYAEEANRARLQGVG